MTPRLCAASSASAISSTMRRHSASSRAASAQTPLERFAADVLHRNAGASVEIGDLVDRADEWVIEGCRGACFAEEAVQCVGLAGRGQKLECDLSLQHQILGETDLPHASAAEYFENPVMDLGHCERPRASARQFNGTAARLAGGCLQSSPEISGWEHRASTRADRPARAARCGAPKSLRPGARRPKETPRTTAG